MADDKPTPPSDETAETEAIPAATPEDDSTAEPAAAESTTDVPRVEPAAATVPATDGSRARRKLDTRSVIVTAAAIAALAASFGVGYAVGDHNGDDDGHRGRFDRMGAPGTAGGPGGGPGMRGGGERGSSFDRGFDGPRGGGLGGAPTEGRGFRGPGGVGGDVVMGTITKLDGDQLTIDPLGDDTDDATTVTLADDVRVIKRGSDGREDGSKGDLDTGALVVTRGPRTDADDTDSTVDTIVVLQAS